MKWSDYVTSIPLIMATGKAYFREQKKGQPALGGSSERRGIFQKRIMKESEGVGKGILDYIKI